MNTAIREVLVRARSWAKARAKCRRIADSKSAKPAALERAKAELATESDKLFKAVTALESFLRSKPNKRKNEIDWHSVLGTVSAAVQGVVGSIRQRPGFSPEVIDTTGEEVDLR